MLGLAAFFVMLNILFYIPARVWGVRGMHQITREPMKILAEISADDALIIVHAQKRFEYARLLPLVEPYREIDLTICSSYGFEADDRVIRWHSDRKIFHYYPETPGRLYPDPRFLKRTQE